MKRTAASAQKCGPWRRQAGEGPYFAVRPHRPFFSVTRDPLGLPGRWISRKLSNVIHGWRGLCFVTLPRGKVADRRPLQHPNDRLLDLDPSITRGTNVFPVTRLGTIDAVDGREGTIEDFANFPERNRLGRPGQRVTTVGAAHGSEQAARPQYVENAFEVLRRDFLASGNVP